MNLHNTNGHNILPYFIIKVPPLDLKLFSVPQYIIVSSLLNASPLQMFEYHFPEWSVTAGYFIAASSFICIPMYMVYKLVWTPGSLKQVLLIITPLIKDLYVWGRPGHVTQHS